MPRVVPFLDALASFVARARYEEIPDRVVAMARIHIVDAMAVALAGSRAPLLTALHRHLRDVNAGADAEVLGGGCTATPQAAAFANTLSGRVLDYDDVQTTESAAYGTLTHPSAPVLWPALAVGQARRASGRDLLLAYVVGVEVECRMADAVDPKEFLEGLSATATFGGLGATAAVSKLVGLRPKEIAGALSLWMALGAWRRDPAEGPGSAAFRDAHAAEAGLTSALYASHGMMLGARPFVSTLGDGFVSHLGDPFYLLKPGLATRVYPSHPLCHPAQDLILALVNLYGIRANQIRKVEVGITTVMSQILSVEPPATAAAARTNLPFAIALGVCRGAADLKDFKRPPNNPAFRQLMRNVTCYVDPELDALGYNRAWTRLRVLLDNGRVIEMKTDVAKGSPQKPLSQAELSHKFYQCALGVLDEEHAQRLLDRLWSLDEVSDVAELFKPEPDSSIHVIPAERLRSVGQLRAKLRRRSRIKEPPRRGRHD